MMISVTYINRLVITKYKLKADLDYVKKRSTVPGHAFIQMSQLCMCLTEWERPYKKGTEVMKVEDINRSMKEAA